MVAQKGGKSWRSRGRLAGCGGAGAGQLAANDNGQWPHTHTHNGNRLLCPSELLSVQLVENPRIPPKGDAAGGFLHTRKLDKLEIIT